MTKKRRTATKFAPDRVMTISELADALRCSVSTIKRMDLPTVYLGRHTKRYIWGQVLEVLKERAA